MSGVDQPSDDARAPSLGRPWSEDETHRWLASFPRPRGLAGSPQHDAAVLVPLDDAPVICTDQCIEGVHFDRSTHPRAAGAKAVLRTLSDLAATAAQPVAVTLAIAAPEASIQQTVQELIEGARAAARRFGADLLAGDLASTAGPLSMTVTALGGFEGEDQPPGRDRAEPGQGVLVTGPLGGSLPSGRHLNIEPRIEWGRALHSLGATAMMDVSDGLAVDLFRLARASGVGIELDVGAIPIHADAEAYARVSGKAPSWHALHDGEDHELVATIAEIPASSPAAWSVIGRVLEGSGLLLKDAAARTEVAWAPTESFRHGRR